MRRGSRLHIGHPLRNLCQRRREQADIQNKGNNHTKLNARVQRQNGADYTYRDIGQITDDIHQGLHDT